MTKLERDYQSGLIVRIYRRFEGCEILKNDTGYRQGIPDLTVFYRDRWGVLETKRKKPTKDSDWEPNQQYWLEVFNRMSFARCIYPENEEEVLNALQLAFQSRRPPRISQPQQVPLDQLRRREDRSRLPDSYGGGAR